MKTRRGPRLATKLMLMGIFLLSIPWLGYRYLIEMKNFLIEGQAQAQLLTAKGIALTLQSNDNLFNDLPLTIEDYQTLTTYPLDYPIRIDGYQDDWRDISQHMQSFGEQAGQGRFRLMLGVNTEYLYAYLKIDDATPIFRHPGFRRLDNSDHLRLNFIAADDSSIRLLLTAEGDGNMTAYYVDEDWAYAAQGQPENRIRSFIRSTAKGYDLEFRIPLDMLGPHKRLGIAYGDINDPQSRILNNLTGTLPVLDKANLNLVLLRSPAIEKVIKGLNQGDARIWILDRRKRVRAIAGELSSTDPDLYSGQPRENDPDLWPHLMDFLFQQIISPAAASFQDFDPKLTNRREDEVISAALDGAGKTRRRLSVDGRAEIITSAYPILENNQVTGAVVLEQSTHSILALQRQSLEKIVSLTAASLLAIFIAVSLFSVRLTWRIRRVRREAGGAIDPHGRLVVDRLRHETGAGDEIGDLARSVSAMLAKLHQYQQFVANIPRTLRHEVNNPLNTISTSLENLAGETNEPQRQLYLERAKRGLHQISLLVQQLSESASLEQALINDELEPVDLNALMQRYLNNYQHNHPQQRITQYLQENPVWIDCADFRIEQLLDKLLDNAVDFSDGQPVKAELLVYKNHCEMIITNQGPVIDRQQIPLIFNSMSSSRPTLDSKKPHLGLGLYISKLIVDYHSGTIHINNLADQSGVSVKVSLPLSKELG